MLCWVYSLCVIELFLSVVVSVTLHVTLAPEVLQYSRDIHTVSCNTIRLRREIAAVFQTRLFYNIICKYCLVIIIFIFLSPSSCVNDASFVFQYKSSTKITIFLPMPKYNIFMEMFISDNLLNLHIF
jgi:hypothetical protein